MTWGDIISWAILIAGAWITLATLVVCCMLAAHLWYSRREFWDNY